MEDKIENERFLLLQQQMPFVSLGNLLAGLGMVSMLWAVIPHHILLIWYGLLLLFWGGRGLHSHIQNKKILILPQLERKEDFIIYFPLFPGFFGEVQVYFFSPQNSQLI